MRLGSPVQVRLAIMLPNNLNYKTFFILRILAILVPVLKSISHLISLDLIQEKLKENPVVTVSLLEITSDCVQSLCERMGDASYRNWGGIRYGGFVLMHLSNILGNDHSVSPVWILHCIPVITFLSNIENPLIKASALQVYYL